MTLNQSAEHALRAVLHMARHGEGQVQTVADISESLSIPAPYLGKIMTALTRARVVTAVRGRHGGIRLAASPAAITVAEVVAPFQEIESESRCLMSDRPCDQTSPCSAHQRWRRMQEGVEQFLKCTSIEAMLRPIEERTPDGTGGYVPDRGGSVAQVNVGQRG